MGLRRCLFLIGFGILSLFLSSSLWGQSASEEISDIANQLDGWNHNLNMQIELLEKQLLSLTAEQLKDKNFTDSLNRDLERLKVTLAQAQMELQTLQRDYEKSLKRSGRWKTLSIVLGGTTVISVGGLILFLALR